MTDNDEVFPESSLDEIIRKIKSGQRRYPSLQQYVIELIKVLDKNGDNLISFDEFSAGMKKMGVVLTDHEIHVLVRKFDHNKDGKISMEEFYNTLAAT
jgi:Ca2+-binding EF-hand superfamily protein